ncbi:MULTISPECIES: ribokinase [unclassified Amycolatopsis]|uniref:ribokinase n=1 Tax=unclassified Amycolatopsis TaxID=2618356 RepID=UPI001C6A210B|nr:ribokinase [Amycolatopsis sp. DSM 110486]QYN24127.1 ribokinase [Amycolatopsis sp. DSM 110486]
MCAAVLVVGSANADLVVPVDRRPAGGETVLGGDTVLSPGGKGANTAVAAGRLGADVALLGAIGDDPYGELLRDSLAGAGVGTEHLRTVRRPTGIAYITVTPDGENSILVSPGANSALAPGDLTDVVLDGAKIVVLSLEVPLPTVEHAVARAAAKGVPVLLNLSPAARLPPETLGALDVLLVNEHEAAYLLGSPGADPRELLELGPRAAVVTLGPKGAVVVASEGVTEVASPQVQAVDTTGAGDAFAGALAAALAEGAGLVDATRRAVRVAAVSVTRPGAQPSYPTSAELE